MLFKSTNELIEYAEIGNEMNFYSIKATLRKAEEMYLIPEIGQEQYNELHAAYQGASDEASLADRLQTLLDKCRGVVGPMFVYLQAPKGEIKLDDSGLNRLETETAKSAFQYQVTNFREAAMSEGEVATELLLAFLDANKDDYPLWVGNPAHNEYKSFFIPDAKTFQKNFHTHAPHRIFRAMQFKMYDVEELIVKPKITVPVYLALKQKQLAGTDFTDADNNLLKMLQKAIAYLTVALAIPYLRVRIDGNGLTIMAQKPAGNNEKLNTRTEAGDTAVSHLIRNSTETGQLWLQNAFDFILANPTLFPAYVVPKVVSIGSCNDDYIGAFGIS